MELALSDSWQRVYVDFAPDSEAAISFFKTAGFNRSPTPPFLSITCNCAWGMLVTPKRLISIGLDEEAGILRLRKDSSSVDLDLKTRSARVRAENSRMRRSGNRDVKYYSTSCNVRVMRTPLTSTML